MCNLNDLKPLRCAAIVRDADGNLRKLHGKFRSLAEMWEYARSIGLTIIRYQTFGAEV